MAVSQEVLDEGRTLWQRVAAWGLANSMAQKFQTENAAAAQQLGMSKPFEMLPFGNVNISAPAVAPAAQAAPAAASGTSPLMAAVIGAAIGAGGLGLGSFLTKPPSSTTPAPIAAPSPSVENIPLTIDWEFTTDGQRAIESE